MDWREQILAEAKTWLNTPYHSMARVKGAGVDCGQFILAVYISCGLIEPVETGAYSPEWHLHRGEEKYLLWVKTYCNPVDEPEPGDIMMYQFGRCQSHGGIYMGDGEIIHAFVDRGVIISRLEDAILLDAKGRSRYRGSWRLKGR